MKHCDCNIDEKHSFGLSARQKKKELDYYPHGKYIGQNP
jgi:hypothetical protein